LASISAKRRGRPPKAAKKSVAPTAVMSSLRPTSKGAKKSRGRPRKHTLPVEDVGSDEEQVSAAHEQVGNDSVNKPRESTPHVDEFERDNDYPHLSPAPRANGMSLLTSLDQQKSPPATSRRSFEVESASVQETSPPAPKLNVVRRYLGNSIRGPGSSKVKKISSVKFQESNASKRDAPKERQSLNGKKSGQRATSPESISSMDDDADVSNSQIKQALASSVQRSPSSIGRPITYPRVNASKPVGQPVSYPRVVAPGKPFKAPAPRTVSQTSTRKTAPMSNVALKMQLAELSASTSSSNPKPKPKPKPAPASRVPSVSRSSLGTGSTARPAPRVSSSRSRDSDSESPDEIPYRKPDLSAGQPTRGYGAFAR
jgi:hypothetical protein